jgi:hypothetical protein
MRTPFNLGRFKNYTDFEGDVLNNNLSDYTFIVPRFSPSDTELAND